MKISARKLFLFSFFFFQNLNNSKKNNLANAKEREWDNIITCHEGDNAAYTWNYEKKAVGSHKLLCKSQVKVCYCS